MLIFPRIFRNKILIKSEKSIDGKISVFTAIDLRLEEQVSLPSLLSIINYRKAFCKFIINEERS